MFWTQNEDEKFDLNFISFICSIRETMLREKKGNQEERPFAKALDWKELLLLWAHCMTMRK